MYGVNVKMTGSGASILCGLKTVAFNLMPSRAGILTPHSRSIAAGSAPNTTAVEKSMRRSWVFTCQLFSHSRFAIVVIEAHVLSARLATPH